MDNSAKSPEVGTQIRTSNWNWIIGILLLLTGLGVVGGLPLLGTLFIIVGIVLLPPIVRKIKEKYGYSLFIDFSFKPKLSFICTNCENVTDSVKKRKGSGWIELILWFFFLLPGIIYSIWRRSNRDIICPHCKQISLVPIDSPAGKKILLKNNK